MSDNNKKKPLYETENYKLVVDNVRRYGLEGDNDSYIIVNKNTGVAEIDTRLLPQAYTFIDQMEKSLETTKRDIGSIETGPSIKQAVANLTKTKPH